MQEIPCQVCGNTISPTAAVCPFCQSPCEPVRQEQKGLEHRILNLEKGMPLVEQAMERLRNELYLASRQGVKVITLIHGYGSTGKGGSIRREIRQHLSFLHHQHRINQVIPGEEFAKKSGQGRQLIRRFPFLAEHRDLNKRNPGVTLVIL
ncbi:MAG: hypothetical protein CSB34_01345 [Desulfobulbus propionicus]|nr:MAG: hypothetical protein CSB34_01345 [Desulfobulbus propionicus]